MNKAEKVLLALARLCRETKAAVSYEDLVVAAFEAFPEDFALRGYPQYPDASDVHKPIYKQLRPQGLVLVSNKTFRITEAGAHRAAELESHLSVGGGSSAEEAGSRLSRAEEAVVQRQLRSAAKDLVVAGREKELIDTDCQRFYGFAPWSTKKEAQGRRAEFIATLAILKQTSPELARVLDKTDAALFERFSYLFEED